MLSVVIPFYSNIDGLSVLLTLLQTQTKKPDKIIVIDNSPSKIARAITMKYSINIRIECHVLQQSIYQSWNKGIQLSKGYDIVFVNDDVLVPLDFIELVVKAMSKKEAYGYVPEGPSITHRGTIFNSNTFSWYSENKKMRLASTDWLKGYCFILPKTTIQIIGTFDTSFELWYGDFDYQERILRQAEKQSNIMGICKICNLMIYHYGSNSFSISSREDMIGRDEKQFNNKYYPGANSAILHHILREQDE